MENNYDKHRISKNETDCNNEYKTNDIANKDSIMNTLKRLLGKDKEHDIHGLSQFAWP